MASVKLIVLASTGSAAFGSTTEDSANLGMMVRQLDDAMTGRIDVGLEWCWDMVKFQGGACEFRRALKAGAGAALEW